jgi:hypothetical protein
MGGRKLVLAAGALLTMPAPAATAIRLSGK